MAKNKHGKSSPAGNRFASADSFRYESSDHRFFNFYYTTTTKPNTIKIPNGFQLKGIQVTKGHHHVTNKHCTAQDHRDVPWSTLNSLVVWSLQSTTKLTLQPRPGSLTRTQPLYSCSCPCGSSHTPSGPHQSSFELSDGCHPWILTWRTSSSSQHQFHQLNNTFCAHSLLPSCCEGCGGHLSPCTPGPTLLPLPGL